jgi:glucose/arabinose dehydrogenase
MPFSVRATIAACVAGVVCCAIPLFAQTGSSLLEGASAFGDWRADRPGTRRLIRSQDLPAPDLAESTRNFVRTVHRTNDQKPIVPNGFEVNLFASGLAAPRLIRVAPNGDVFVAESAVGRIRVLRPDGNAAPRSTVFASGMRGPFGIAFYPPGPDPQWVYVGNTDSVVRFAYRNGDLTARDAAETIVPNLPAGGAHITRDVVFSPDGKTMYVSVGSGSNVADGMATLSAGQLQTWQSDHALGATWGNETDRADVLAFDPQGKNGRVFATGIRNCVGMAIARSSGTVWCSTNERDGLGDNVPTDYITRVREGAFYGWPWYYIGAHEDPRRAGERPDLRDKVTVPDVLIQAHSASLGMTFYDATQFPPQYRGNIFAAEHGSWNRSKRTGYKVIRVLVKAGAPTGEYEDFATGFVIGDAEVWGRPVGVAVDKDGALLVSEDASGTIWRITMRARPQRHAELRRPALRQPQ